MLSGFVSRVVAIQAIVVMTRAMSSLMGNTVPDSALAPMSSKPAGSGYIPPKDWASHRSSTQKTRTTALTVATIMATTSVQALMRHQNQRSR